ncbi:MAG: dihydrofolate reductase [Pseudomonadota bacterium]|nr:dihydrofolate reductase [Pseudomonadota bacterium]
MKISIVVAMAANCVIGRDNQLPWHFPADLRHFKKITIGKPVIMGRKTHESIGRALPERTNIVMTRNADYVAPGCVVVHSLEEAFRVAAHNEEVMVIGGAEFYRQVLPEADTLYLTKIHHEFEGDTFFPELNSTEWREVERIDCEPDEKNPHHYSFIQLERVTP